MPVITSTYRCHPFFRNGHVQTLYPRLVRSRPAFRPEAQTLKTPDGDELELFVHRKPNQRELVIFTHGLESHGKEASLLRFAETAASWGYDTINWSMRSCGKRLNRTRWFYLGHDYRDLKTLVDTFGEDYDRVYLVSVSLGGTITANYLGREGAKINSVVKGAFLLSPPLELNSFHAAMARPLNHCLYQRHVVRSLLGKFERKAEFMDFGEGVDVARVRRSKSVDRSKIPCLRPCTVSITPELIESTPRRCRTWIASLSPLTSSARRTIRLSIPNSFPLSWLKRARISTWSSPNTAVTPAL